MTSVLLTDAHGQQLAVGRIVPVDARTYRFRPSHGRGRLLGYYFGQGRRQLMIEAGTFRIRADVSTEWVGHERRWTLMLQRAGQPPSQPETTRRVDLRSA